MRTPGKLFTASCLAAIVVVSAGPAAAAQPRLSSDEPVSTAGLEPRVADLVPRTTNLQPRVKDVKLRTRKHTYTVESDVLFAFDSAKLSPGATDILANVARGLLESGTRQVTVTGHTDSIGSRPYNQRLSERRASAVRDYLKSELDDPRIHYTATGKGETQPVAPNVKKTTGADNPNGRAKNRRVIVTYVK